MPLRLTTHVSHFTLFSITGAVLGYDRSRIFICTNVP